MVECLVIDPPEEWELVVEWSVKALQGKSLKSTICKVSLGAVYYLWMQRNALIHGQTPKTEEMLLA